MFDSGNRHSVLTSSTWLSVAVAGWMAVAISITALSAEEPKAQSRPAALPSVPAAGLVVYKLHSQDDEFAPCVEYANIKLFPTVANMTTMNGRYFSVQRGQMAYHIDYPSPNGTLLDDSDVERLRKLIAEYKAAALRFKYTAPKLAPWIAKLQQDLAMMNQGFGRTDGRWVNRASYTYERERARLREDFAFRKAQILGKKPPPVAVDQISMSMWAEAMEAQTRAQHAEFREQFRKRIEAKRLARTRKFHETTESKLSRKTPGKLAPAKRLDRPGTLDASGGLDHTAPLGSR